MRQKLRGDRLLRDTALRRKISGRLQVERHPPLYGHSPALCSIRPVAQSAPSLFVRYILGILGSGEMALCGIGRMCPALLRSLGEDSLRKVCSPTRS